MARFVVHVKRTPSGRYKKISVMKVLSCAKGVSNSRILAMNRTRFPGARIVMAKTRIKAREKAAGGWKVVKRRKSRSSGFSLRGFL